uniref:Protein KRI1 homolog n=1 Tax=Laticauda laticaudata TaxID=8630 RepID=A0A8C5SQK5_LATLA
MWSGWALGDLLRRCPHAWFLSPSVQDKYGEEEKISSSESASSEEEELDPRWDRAFYSMLGLLKMKDPRIYQKNVTFYTEEDSCSATLCKKTSTKKKEKPMLLKDYERKVMVEKAGKYEDEEDEEEITVKSQLTYVEEQKELKESFRKFVAESDEEEGDNGNSSALLQKRVKSKEEKEHEEADYISWLKGQKKLEAENELQDLIPLKIYWNDPKLDEGEQFLRDYILNQCYKEGSSEEEQEQEQEHQQERPCHTAQRMQNGHNRREKCSIRCYPLSEGAKICITGAG